MASLLTIAAALSVFMRLRRATGVERQQVKWFVYAAAANVSGSILAYVIPGVIDTPVWFEQVGFALNIVTIPAIPAAIAIAILRYRLYEIDLIINRTLVYGSLTVTLALVYFGGVTATQSIFRSLTGREEQPQRGVRRLHRLHPGHSRPVQPFETPHPVLHRPSLLPQQVRRPKDARNVIHDAAGRDGPGCAERHPGGGGEGDDAAGVRHAVVAPRLSPEAKRRIRVTPQLR
jgi:hypothetical protein